MSVNNTKEKILRDALRLFASQGYVGASVRDIAAGLGLTQSALYKHYTGKRQIFDCILARMEENDWRQARAFQMPESSYAQNAAAYRQTGLDELKRYTLAQFSYWTEDEFAADFRRLLTLEQYRSPEMQRLYQQYLSGGVIDYLTDLFRELTGTASARDLALSFYGPVYLLLNLYDGAPDPSLITQAARERIMSFYLPNCEADAKYGKQE